MVHYKSDLLGMETSDELNRANIVKLIAKDNFYNARGNTDYMPTFWMFDKNPKGESLNWCVACGSCKPVL